MKTIKRKDIIEDKALNFGKRYAKNIKKAIKANKKFQKQINRFVEEKYFVNENTKCIIQVKL